MIVLLRLLRHPWTLRAKAFCALTRRCWIPGGIRWATGMFTCGTCTSAPGQSAKEQLTIHEKEASPVLKFEHARIERPRRRQDKMKAKKRIRPFRHFFAAAAAILLFANVALAGPPLICHAFEIGQAKSLPLASNSWNLSGSENYDTKNLAGDTLEILKPDTPVLVRMETLRRATLYARKDPLVAKELLARLHARATAAESAGHPDALAWFDAGYLVETYKQWLGQNLPHMTDGMRTDPNPAAGVDGYALVKKAIALRGDDAQMEFAAALITLSGPREEHAQHAQKAIAGAKMDALLAQNLATHFLGGKEQTVAEMLAKGSTRSAP